MPVASNAIGLIGRHRQRVDVRTRSDLQKVVAPVGHAGSRGLPCRRRGRSAPLPSSFTV